MAYLSLPLTLVSRPVITTVTAATGPSTVSGSSYPTRFLRPKLPLQICSEKLKTQRSPTINSAKTFSTGANFDTSTKFLRNQQNLQKSQSIDSNGNTKVISGTGSGPRQTLSTSGTLFHLSRKNLHKPPKKGDDDDHHHDPVPYQQTDDFFGQRPQYHQSPPLDLPTRKNFDEDPEVKSIQFLRSTGYIKTVTKKNESSDDSDTTNAPNSNHNEDSNDGLKTESQGVTIKIIKDDVTLLDVIERNPDTVQGIEASCGGIAACSTCHCYLTREDYKMFPEPDESELDMLDLAADFIEGRSRLACQLELDDYGAGDDSASGGGSSDSSDKKGGHMKVIIPSKFRNLMDFIPFEDRS